MRTRQLVIVRHAKAEPYAATDVERSLSNRGRADALVLGQWLAAHGVQPDRALVSYAARTRQTWTNLAAGANWQLEPTYDEDLYGADEFELLRLIGQTSADVDSLIIVGHNPTMGSIAAQLDDGAGAAAGAATFGSFPTATAAVFAVDGPWNELNQARLDAFEVARAD